MRKLSLATVVCFTLFSQSSKAQYYFYNDKYYERPVVYEVGLSAGIINAFTDLGGKKGIGKNFIKDLRWKTAKPSFGVFLLANYLDKISVRLEGTFGEVVGYDSILKNVASSTYGRYERNLSFKSRISEVHLGVEVHPLMFRNYDDYDPPLMSPYVMGGIGYFSFDPQAKLNGAWYSLQPLHTEGQGFAEYPDRKEYSLQQLNFLAGFGFKYQISPLLNAKVEFTQRFLTTDYLDDVSTNYIDPTLFTQYLGPNRGAIATQLHDRKYEITPGDGSIPLGQRGDPSDNDSYFTVQLKLALTLGRQQR